VGPSLIVAANQQTTGDPARDGTAREDTAPDDTAREDTPGDSQRRWLAVRGFLNSRRHRLGLAALQMYPQAWRVAGTPLLARPGWLPAAPVPLEKVTLTWRGGGPAAPVDGNGPGRSSATPLAVAGGGPEFAGVLPLRDDGSRFSCYADAVAALARPGLFEDRTCYRLLDAAATPRGAELAFGPGRYFDMVNVCEAVAHEYAAAAMAGGGADHTPGGDQLPLRALLGDPADLRRRRVMVAVCTLVLRVDRARGDTAMLLHWRDPQRVASGGGLYQVAPAGMFQPSHDADWNQANDFDLWRSIVRELSEELLGTGEDYRSDRAPIDYQRWPLHEELARARQAGRLRAYWLGLGVDPLTMVADMLTVAVFDAEVFDAVFAGLVAGNDEGRLVTSPDSARAGVAFTQDSVRRFTSVEPMQAAGAALLRTAWAHRDVLLTPG
jgi:hypothetical protein